ncbi:MAG: hypothetical protein KIT80_16095 [Chitinophagaceae bacterium]|nr:hypothetical protein [Chitinophagaceae bacterium]MCW5928438.1 hypothetical protein [Chitinophagaceae bacterium]
MDAKTFDEIKVLASSTVRYLEHQRRFHEKKIKWTAFRSELAKIHQELIDAYGNKEILYEFLKHLEKEESNEVEN